MLFRFESRFFSLLNVYLTSSSAKYITMMMMQAFHVLRSTYVLCEKAAVFLWCTQTKVPNNLTHSHISFALTCSQCEPRMACLTLSLTSFSWMPLWMPSIISKSRHEARAERTSYTQDCLRYTGSTKEKY